MMRTVGMGVPYDWTKSTLVFVLRCDGTRRSLAVMRHRVEDGGSE